jgi:uncharacterized protein (DUF342 family)
MGSLKDLILSIEEEEQSGDEIEVYADSVKQALEIASREMGIDVSMLDYEILKKGTKGFFSIGRQPYRVLIRPIRVDSEYEDLDKIEKKLSKFSDVDLSSKVIGKNVDGSFTIRVTKSGIWLTVKSPKGRGKQIDMPDVSNKLLSLRIENADPKKIEREVTKQSGKAVRIGDWIPNPDYDGQINVEMSDDEMKAYVHFVPPRFFGRHMEIDDVLEALKYAGVVTCIKEDRIAEYLEMMDYSQPLLAAEGEKPRHGSNAYIDYKFKIEKGGFAFEEDEKGQVDFRDLDLLENVVVGQVLAVKVPAEEGIFGRTVTNRVLPAKSGKDVQISYGKNTILSEDGMELTAATNGQVVYKNGRIYVEEVLFINGDVSLETGNITSLGSVVIAGNVQDNFIVKAAGNVEVKGTVQKALIEAEGDIVVRQGISGRDEAKVESTGGSVFAKFVQRTNITAEKDVVIAEGVLHSNVDAGSRILCNGKRARIVGGLIRAGEEVNAGYIGSDSFTKTELRVGIMPKVIQQVTDLNTIKEQIAEDLSKINKDVTTLTVQKKNAGGVLPKDREELLVKLQGQQEKLTTRQSEVNLELEELKTYFNMLEQKGKVCAEKVVYPGVEIFIKDKKFTVRDQYNYIRFALEGGEIRLSEYEPPKEVEAKRRFIRRRT